MLIDVLTRLSNDTGYSLSQKRSSLLLLANRAAREMHKKLECNKIYREVTLVVTPDAVCSLPSFIGELKGMRMHTNEIPFDLQSIGMPRYINTTLEHKFKNWRDLGEVPTEVLPAQVGQLTLITPAVETVPITVLINGNTNNATRIEELVVMDAPSKTSVNLFGQQIQSIACVTPNRVADITIKDVNGNQIAILYNTDTKTRYKLVDVSQLFWTVDLSSGETLIDICYKVPAVNLSRDSDSFYAGDDYDEAWYSYAMSIFLAPLENRKQESMLFLAAALDVMNSAKNSGEGGIVKRLSFGRNKFFGIFRRWRYFPGSVTNVDNNTQH